MSAETTTEVALNCASTPSVVTSAAATRPVTLSAWTESLAEMSMSVWWITEDAAMSAPTPTEATNARARPDESRPTRIPTHAEPILASPTTEAATKFAYLAQELISPANVK